MAGLPAIFMSDHMSRSVPGTPYLHHPHLSHQEMNEAVEQARFGLDRPDYFAGATQYGVPIRSRSPYSIGGMEGMSQDEAEHMMQDRIRRYVLTDGPVRAVLWVRIYIVVLFLTSLLDWHIEQILPSLWRTPTSAATQNTPICIR